MNTIIILLLSFVLVSTFTALAFSCIFEKFESDILLVSMVIGIVFTLLIPIISHHTKQKTPDKATHQKFLDIVKNDPDFNIYFETEGLDKVIGNVNLTNVSTVIIHKNGKTMRYYVSQDGLIQYQ